MVRNRTGSAPARLALVLGVFLTATVLSGHSAAGSGSHAADSLNRLLSGLPTGEQLQATSEDAVVYFAGSEVQLKNFSGVLGYASQAAYVLVLEGSATAGDQTAEKGWMLLMAPFETRVARERFDAVRLKKALGDKPGSPEFMAALDQLAQRQSLGVFLGRLQPTGFNVATMNSVAAEQDRRQRVGDVGLRDIRFVGSQGGGDPEQRIVSRFMTALAQGDVETVSQFLDPLPYGYNNLEAGGGEARRLMARALVEERDWAGFANSTPSRLGDTGWLVPGQGPQARVMLRRTSEFAFVESIRVEQP